MQCRQAQSQSIKDGGAPSSAATQKWFVLKYCCLQSNKPCGGENTTSENTTI